MATLCFSSDSSHFLRFFSATKRSELGESPTSVAAESFSLWNSLGWTMSGGCGSFSLWSSVLGGRGMSAVEKTSLSEALELKVQEAEVIL